MRGPLSWPSDLSVYSLGAIAARISALVRWMRSSGPSIRSLRRSRKQQPPPQSRGHAWSFRRVAPWSEGGYAPPRGPDYWIPRRRIVPARAWFSRRCTGLAPDKWNLSIRAGRRVLWRTALAFRCNQKDRLPRKRVQRAAFHLCRPGLIWRIALLLQLLLFLILE